MLACPPSRFFYAFLCAFLAFRMYRPPVFFLAFLFFDIPSNVKRSGEACLFFLSFTFKKEKRRPAQRAEDIRRGIKKAKKKKQKRKRQGAKLFYKKKTGSFACLFFYNPF